MLSFAIVNNKFNILILFSMLNILVDIENAEARKRFVSSVCSLDDVTEFTVKMCGSVSVNFCCKDYCVAINRLSTVRTILQNLELDVRPFAFRFSELLD